MPRLSPTRVASTYVAAMPREACIVAAGKFGQSFCLLKNRDRNYLPHVKVVHEVRDGVEVAYMKDDKTGWVEGLNEHGIGIVNAALMVSRDESERDEVERTGKKLLDGDRILKALSERTVAAVVKSVRTYQEGLKGHTIVSDGKKTVYVEMPDTSDEEHGDVPAGKVFVRTNHGVDFPDAGYVEGPREESSKSRQEEAEDVLSKVKSPDEVAPAILRARDDRWEPTEMVRDSKSDRKMRTTTQMVLDLTKKKLTLYLLPERVKYLGLDDRLPKDFEPRITIEVVEYEDLKEETDAETEPVAKRKKASGQLSPADFVGRFGGRAAAEAMFEGLMSQRVASKHLMSATTMGIDGMKVIDNAGYKDLTGIRRIPVARGSDGEVVVGNEAIDEAGARISGKPYMTDAVMAKLFDGSPLVITEKVDGHPLIILYGGYTFFCEGLRVQHSVDYDNVPYSLDGWPDMAVVYDVLDGELEPPYSKGQGTGKWLTRSEQETLCSSVGAPIVPLVWEGHVEPEDLPKLADRISSFSGGAKAEGIVLKNYRTGVFGKFINLEFQSRLSDESLHPGGVHPMQRGVKNTRKWTT